jgi:hypothetical protein
LLQMFQFGVSPQHQICVPTSYNNIRDKKVWGRQNIFFYYIGNLTTILVSQLSMKTAFLHKEAATKFVWHLGTKDPKVGTWTERVNVGTVSSIRIKCSLEWWVVAGNDGATYLCRLWESGNATMLTLQDWMVWNPPPCLANLLE